MKTTRMLTIMVLALGLMFCLAEVSEAASMGTGFTYQGHLYDTNYVADGEYDFQFELYDDPCTGTQQGSTIYLDEVDVIDALFTVELDFGSDVFEGEARWLEIGVRPGEQSDPCEYTILEPRQEVTPTPYAIYAQSDGDWMVSGNDMYSIPSGNVGIGTMSPDYPLEINGSGYQLGLVSDSWSAGLFIESYRNTTQTHAVVNCNAARGTKSDPNVLEDGDQITRLISRGYDGEDFIIASEIRTAVDGEPNDSNMPGRIEFLTTTKGQSIASKKMTIKNNGDVGIGTTSPGSKLEVNGQVKITGGSPGAGKVLTSDASGLASWQTPAAVSDGDWIISGADMYSNPSGKVGIGTTNPQAKLSVGGDGIDHTGVYGSGSTNGVYGIGTIYGVYGTGNNIGVYGRGDNTGLHGYCYDGSGTNYGVDVYAGSTGSNNAYGVYSRVSRDGTGTYWSGYFIDQFSGGAYGGLYADVRSGGAIDIAEYILDTKGDTEAGDVLIADPDNDESVVKSSIPYDSSVVGIVSTQPHLLIGMELVMDEETGEMYEDVNATKLAVAGRVPVKVTDENGPIERGDLLTTSSRSGYAMKWTLLDVKQAEDFDELKSMLAENERRRNAIVGKALGNLDSGDGKIVALVNLQ